MMTQENKITQEELSKFNSLQDNWNLVISKIGILTTEKMQLHDRIDDIEKEIAAIYTEFLKHQAEEAVFAGDIQKKYGSIELNSETGEYFLQK
jgi:hypothetical protein